MFINKLYLQHFGKYHNREVELQKGINLIYGPNEAGKTTIKDFIIGMFYGVERLRGVAARTDEYTRREPLDGSGYAGSMELITGDSSYLIERVFRKDRKSLKVHEESSGREIPVQEDQSLKGTIVDLDKNGYINTLCISSHGAAYKQELQEEFRQYLMNINETHTGNLNVKDANAYLNQQKKALNRKGLENELRTIDRRQTELHLEEELEQLGKQREELEQKLLQGTESVSRTEETGKSGNQEESQTKSKRFAFGMSEEEKRQIDPQLRQILSFLKVLFAFGLFALVLLIIFILPVSLYYKGWLCVIAVVVGLYLWIMCKINGKKKSNASRQSEKRESTTTHDKQGQTASSSKGNKGEVPESNQILEYSRRLADLQVKENDLLREYAKQQELKLQYETVKQQIEKVDFELEAIELAQTRIQELSGNIYGQYGPAISRRVSQMVSRITEGAYTDVKLDEQLNIKVRKDGKYLGAEFLSTGTLEQIYLAVRLAVAEEMSHAGMPLLLDDIFGAYDDERLEMVLQCLADYKAEQVIIFTASDRLADALDRTDMDYNYVEI